MAEDGFADALFMHWPLQEEMMRSADGMFPEYHSAMEAFEAKQCAYEAPGSGDACNEAEIVELAAELLEVSDEAELNRPASRRTGVRNGLSLHAHCWWCCRAGRSRGIL
jgi:hypothetical protein